MQNPKKIIFHIDMNAFFASCEELKYPFLKGKPMAVGRRHTLKSVLSTCNYEARKYNVRSGMSTIEALRLCPNLIITDGDHKFYQQISRKIMNIFNQYSDKVEQFSIDEAFLDVTHSKIDPISLAKNIQNKVLNDVGISCSIGIANTLYLAKMASDYKKPLGITTMYADEVYEKLSNLPISSLFGVGKASVKTFEKNNIFKIKDFLDLGEYYLTKNKIGSSYYIELYKALLGESNDIVDPYRHSENQSIGHSRTYPVDLTNITEITEAIKELAYLVSSRMEKYHQFGKTITLQIKYFDFKVRSKSKTLNKLINSYLDIVDNALLLLDEFNIEKPIRLLGVSMSNLSKTDKEVNLFSLENITEKDEKLNNAISKIKIKYGNEIIKKGIK